eukprot:9466972-Pyramimonas_sp.AAC.2
MQVLVFTEPTATWSEVFVPDFAAFTNAAASSTAQDLKLVILSAFEPICVNGVAWKFGVDDLEITNCQGSHPDGDQLGDKHHLINGKWYYVTANRLLEQLEVQDQIEAAADDVQ